jgi:hypothetical protein
LSLRKAMMCTKGAKQSSKRIEFARCARPTRKGAAPLLAAHSRRHT